MDKELGFWTIAYLSSKNALMGLKTDTQIWRNTCFKHFKRQSSICTLSYSDEYIETKTEVDLGAWYYIVYNSVIVNKFIKIGIQN